MRPWQVLKTLGIQAPKLRIVSWNQNTKDFGGDGIPQSFSDNMTRGLELMKFHWNPDWLMTGSWSRHDVITIPIKLQGSKITRVLVNNYADGWVDAAWTVPPFRNTDQGLLVTAICLLCILRCADQNVWVAHSLAPYDSREFRDPNHAVNLAP